MIILTDVDDVLLNYTAKFGEYFGLGQKDPDGLNLQQIYGLTDSEVIGCVDMLNNSKEFSNLIPFADSEKVVNELHKEGFRFYAITACGRDHNIIHSRKENLLNVFGDIFEDIMFVDVHESKYTHLLQFKDSGYVWVEDSVHNYELGEKLGLDSNLIFRKNITAPVEKYHFCWNSIKKHIYNKK